MDRIIVKARLTVDEKANTVEGIAWPYTKGPDTTGDIIVKGAIAPAAAELPMLLEHKTNQLIGLWTRFEDRDDGLYVKGQFNETVLARGVRGQIITGRRNGLSIAFHAKSTRRQGRNRVIDAADMVEVSICERPVHPGAQLTHVKSMQQAEALAAAINRAAAQMRG